MKQILNKIWERWKWFGQLIGDFVARIILSLFYFTVVVPFALGVRLLGNPLTAKAGEGVSSFWTEYRGGV
ncbi:hypothetical protein D6779_04935, partial [Candidatus Parcubacteria bacterium]